MSIWDTFCEKEGAIADGSDGKVACDSYHQYEEDARMISEMGVDSYRFSLAWTRIMPTQGVINPEGVQYYRNLIAALEARNIEPMVTIYHWDLPQALEDEGGWLNADVALWFEEYARACFQELGDKVRERNTQSCSFHYPLNCRSNYGLQLMSHQLRLSMVTEMESMLQEKLEWVIRCTLLATT